MESNEKMRGGRRIRKCRILLAALFLLCLTAWNKTAATAGEKAAGAAGHATVSLYDTSWKKLYQKITVRRGETLHLPGIVNPKGKTVLGWSEKKCTEGMPQYQIGEKIKVTKSLKLYPVVFSRKEEPDLSRKELKKWNSQAQGDGGKYKRIIFVGDSRTVGLERTLTQEFGSKVTKNVYFIARSGAKLDWFREEGKQALLRLAKKDTAIIFNLGVNQLYAPEKFVSYMTVLGHFLKSKKCTLFYMSVNPFNDCNGQKFYYPKKYESLMIRFNKIIKNELCEKGLYQYLDCYRYLLRNGYGTAFTASGGGDTDLDDGLHYTRKTYKRIYQFCLREICRY